MSVGRVFCVLRYLHSDILWVQGPYDKLVIACDKPVIVCDKPVIVCDKPVIACEKPVIACDKSVIEGT